MTETSTDAASPIETSRYIARLMDMSIRVPGTRFNIGLDGILGLFPVIGDIVTGLAGGFIIFDAVKHKAPPETIGKMAMNLGADVVGGAAVPIAGDLFDIVWKANRRNLTLLEDHLGLPRTYAKGGEDMPTEARYRPQGKVRGVSLSAFVLGGGAAGGGTAGGGEGMITTAGGNVGGYVRPVTINSWTTHTNEVWYRTEDGSETFVLLDANAIPVRQGQRISLVFTAAKHLKGKMALTIVRNHSMRLTKVYPTKQHAAKVAGFGFNLPSLAIIGVIGLGAVLAIAAEVEIVGAILVVIGLGVGLFDVRRIDKRTNEFLAEAAAFAEDESLAPR